MSHESAPGGPAEEGPVPDASADLLPVATTVDVDTDTSIPLDNHQTSGENVGRDGRRMRAGWLGGLFTLGVISLLAMREAGRLIGAVSIGGQTFSASSLHSELDVWRAGTAMHAWAAASCSGVSIKAWLWCQLAFDAPFILGYAGFIYGATRRSLRIGGLLVGLVAANLVQDALAAVGIGLLPVGDNCTANYHYSVLFGFLAAATTIKTAFIAALVVKTGWTLVTRHEAHETIKQIVKALAVQRFIVIVVVVLSALLLLSGKPILEQGVDIERAWFLNSDHLLGIGWLLWAAVFMLALAGGLRYLASVRVALLEDDPASAPPNHGWWKAFRRSLTQKESWQWLLASGLVIGAIFALAATPWVRVYWQAVVCLAGVLIAVPLASAALATVTPPNAIDTESRPLRVLAYKIGRALAWSVPAIVLVSLCRAMVAPMLIGTDRALCWTVFGVGSAVAVAYAVAVLWRNPDGVRDAAGTRTEQRSAWYLIDPQLVGVRHTKARPNVPGVVVSILPAVVVTAVCAVVLLVFPIHVSRLIGGVGIIALSLLLLTALYTTLQIVAQLTDPNHLFRLLRARRTPVVSLALLVGILSTVFATGTSLHNIRQPAAGAASVRDQRPTLHQALESWLDSRAANCAIKSGGQLVQPLLMVAAEGGGVRAAWWTVDAMSVLTSTPCGSKSIFLASGVSGGATGLAVMAGAPTPATYNRPTDAYTLMNKIAGPDALAAGLDGLLSRDLVAGSIGLNVQAADGPAGTKFPDRADLMEQTWEREDSALNAPFPREGTDKKVPWNTVFNGTSVTNTCRVLVSDIKLSTSTRCDDPANTIPGTYDLFSAEPCDLGIATSTASLLAARFPYVTPSGVITSCASPPTFQDQLIDGGYSENSGMDTLDSALTNMMPDIRAYNSSVPAGGALVVPVVIFLHNTVVASDGGPPKTPAAKAEFVVPPTNESDSSVLGANSTLLQRASNVASDWIPDSQMSQADNLRTAVASVLGPQAITVAPQQTPALGLPLGWALSQGTRDTLDNAMNAYLTCDQHKNPCTQSSIFDGLMNAWGAKKEFPPTATS